MGRDMFAFGKLNLIKQPRRGPFFALLPGILLIGLGLAAIFAPQVIAILLAVFLFYIGGIALFLGWKILQWRRRLQGMMGQLANRVQIVSFGSPQSDFDTHFKMDVDSDASLGEQSVGEQSVGELVIGDVIVDDGESSNRRNMRKIILH